MALSLCVPPLTTSTLHCWEQAYIDTIEFEVHQTYSHSRFLSFITRLYPFKVLANSHHSICNTCQSKLLSQAGPVVCECTSYNTSKAPTYLGPALNGRNSFPSFLFSNLSGLHSSASAPQYSLSLCIRWKL